MRTIAAGVGLLLMGQAIGPAQIARAQEAITANRDTIRAIGTIGKGNLTGTFRLTAKSPIEGLKLLMSDLVDRRGGLVENDPIGASTMSITPAIEGGKLPAGVQQLSLQLPSPGETGRWLGVLSVSWEKPAPGQLELPILVIARGRPTLGLATPQPLSFAAATGDSIQFRFQVKETAKAASSIGLQVLVTDLRAAAGSGTRLLRAEKVRTKLVSDTLSGGGLMPVSVAIDLYDVPSGKYTGELRVTDAYLNDLSIPLEVSVRDRWPAPLVAIISGVLLGMIVSGYRGRGKTRDELVVRMELIKTQVSESGKLKPILQRLIDPILAEAQANIAAMKWDPASATVERAEVLLRRWLGAGEEWITQLERLQSLHDSITGDLANAPFGRELQRHLEQIDFAGLQTVLQLTQNLDKVADAIAFFQRRRERLQRIEQDITSISSDAARSQATKKLDDLRAALLQLKFDDKDEATALVTGIESLIQEVRAALEEQEKLEGQIRAYEEQTEQMINELGKPASTKAGQSLARVTRQLLTSVREEESLELHQQRIGNGWRGAWSGLNILQLVTTEPKDGPAQTLLKWLSDPANYDLDTEEFRAAVRALEAPVRAAKTVGPPLPADPQPPRARQMAGKGAAMQQEDSYLDRDDTNGNGGTGEQRFAWISRLRSRFKRDDSAAEAWRSRARLHLFRYGTYLLALVLLVWLGFNQLYASSPTFGAESTKDYLALFLWGFGAEATRSAVGDFVKGLVPAT